MAIDKVSGSQPAKKPVKTNVYDLSTTEGKTAYLKEANAEFNRLMSTRYAALKNNPNYPAFEKKALAAMDSFKYMEQNVGKFDLTSGKPEEYLPPKGLASNALTKIAGDTHLYDTGDKKTDQMKGANDAFASFNETKKLY